MSKLIYFQSQLISAYDPFLRNKDYAHRHWFELQDVDGWGGHLYSRTTKLDVPWALADSLAPIPAITSNETRFDIVLDQIANTFCQQVNQTQRTPHILWSGGIDSTAILISVLKTGNKEILDQLVVVCNQASIEENPYFYNRYIKDKLKTIDTDHFKVTSENYNKILLVNGDCAEMVFGSTHPQALGRQGLLDIIHEPWTNDTLLRRAINTTNSNALDFGFALVKESIKHSPVPIETIFDFLWWHYFNFKIVDSYVRAMVYTADQLTDTEAMDFRTNTFQRFFMYPEMQMWGMLTNNARRETMHLDYKYDAKTYIYNFDHNDFYYNNRQKYPSMIKNTASQHVFAIDENCRRYSFANPDDRRLLGQWLERI